MANKRKGQALLDRVSKMSRELDKFEEEKEEYFGPIAAAFEAEKENKTKGSPRSKNPGIL